LATTLSIAEHAKKFQITFCNPWQLKIYISYEFTWNIYFRVVTRVEGNIVKFSE